MEESSNNFQTQNFSFLFSKSAFDLGHHIWTRPGSFHNYFWKTPLSSAIKVL